MTRRGRNPLRALGPTEVCFPTASREERRLSAVQNAFHRLDTRRNRCSTKGFLPPAFAPTLPLTPPTLGLPEKTVLFGHCKVTVRSPAGSVTFFRECRHLCDPLGFSCLGLTTQARQRARPTRPSARTDCPARPVPAAAPQRLLRPGARGQMCRELHERFMPDHDRTRNRNSPPSNSFLSTTYPLERVAVSRDGSPENHSFSEVRCIGKAGKERRLWTTKLFDGAV